MLLMVKKGVRGGICHGIHRYATANNKYIKYYKKNKELSYLIYWNINNLYGLAMSQKLTLDGFQWKKICLNLMTRLLKTMINIAMNDACLN